MRNRKTFFITFTLWLSLGLFLSLCYEAHADNNSGPQRPTSAAPDSETMQSLCHKLPCSYRSKAGPQLTISGSFSRRPDKITGDLQLVSNGAVIATVNYVLEQGPIGLTLTGQVERQKPFGTLLNVEALPPTKFILRGADLRVKISYFTDQEVVFLGATLAGGKDSAFSSFAGSPAQPKDCEPSKGGKCTAQKDEVRETLECNGLPVAGGFSWIPFLPIVFSNPPEIEACCVNHDLCYNKGGCSRDDEKKCEAELRKCWEKHSGIADLPLVQLVLGTFDMVDNSAFNFKPKGCRCVIKELDEKGALRIVKDVEHDEFIVKHRMCCPAHKICTEKPCRGDLMLDGKKVDSLPGECINWDVVERTPAVNFERTE